MKYLEFSMFCFFVCFALIACGDASVTEDELATEFLTEAPEEPTKANMSLSIPTTAELPACEILNINQLIFIEDIKAFNKCNLNLEWTLVELASPDPEPKNLISTATLNNGDTNCPYGGTALNSGLDLDLNNVLDTPEITNSEYICHTRSQIISSEKIDLGGETCQAGGIKVNYGFDKDSNGTLETEEIENSDSVCSGSNGSDGMTISERHICVGASKDLGVDDKRRGTHTSVTKFSDGSYHISCESRYSDKYYFDSNLSTGIGFFAASSIAVSSKYLGCVPFYVTAYYSIEKNEVMYESQRDYSKTDIVDCTQVYPTLD